MLPLLLSIFITMLPLHAVAADAMISLRHYYAAACQRAARYAILRFAPDGHYDAAAICFAYDAFDFATLLFRHSFSPATRHAYAIADDMP